VSILNSNLELDHKAHISTNERTSHNHEQEGIEDQRYSNRSPKKIHQYRTSNLKFKLCTKLSEKKTKRKDKDRTPAKKITTKGKNKMNPNPKTSFCLANTWTLICTVHFIDISKKWSMYFGILSIIA
jgi:hypothetical protein